MTPSTTIEMTPRNLGRNRVEYTQVSGNGRLLSDKDEDIV